MQYELPVNMSSLDLVASELNASIDQATDAFEEFISDAVDISILTNCSKIVWQIAGTLDLVQIRGAAALAHSIQAAMDHCVKQRKPPSDKLAEALSTALFVLPRYLESVSSRHTDVPLLLVPQINELRLASGQDILFEHKELGISPPVFSQTSDFGLKGSASASDHETLKRLRHMYQVGLLGLIRESKVDLHLRLMLRAVQRLCGLLEAGPAQRFWILVNAVLDAFVERELALNSTRRRLFNMIDKALREISAKPGASGQVPNIPGLEQELYYLVQICDAEPGSSVARFRKAAGISSLPIKESQLQAAMQRMFGPGLDAMATVSKELRNELQQAMGILEILTQSGRTDAEEIEPLKATLAQLAGVLAILNLRGLADYLKAESSVVSGLVEMNATEVQKVLPQIAEGVLFVEHCLDKLDRNQLTPEELENLTPDRLQALNSSSLLDTSRLIVYKEAEAGISLAKRAINSYVESGFDAAHIYNVSTTLNTVRGAFQLLNVEKITQVLSAASRFVKDFIEEKERRSPEKAQQSLATLADALISIEYYLSELSRHQSADEQLLGLAEESLDALGYKVA